MGQPPAATRIKTVQWHEARTEWILAWERRRDHRRARRGDAGGHLILTGSAVDREAILHEYHMFFDRPANLPPEFWEAVDRPPFEPPTNALHHRLGKCFSDGPHGDQRPRTAIARAAGWLCVLRDDEGPIWQPESPMCESVWGHFDEDYDHPEVADMNAAYDNAHREWGPAWQKYRDFCREFG